VVYFVPSGHDKLLFPSTKSDYSNIGKHAEDLRCCLNTSLVNAVSLWNCVPHSERENIYTGVIHIRWSLELFITIFTDPKAVCFTFCSTFTMHCLVLCFVYQKDKAQKSSNSCHVLSPKFCETDFQRIYVWNFKSKKANVQGSIFFLSKMCIGCWA